MHGGADARVLPPRRRPRAQVPVDLRRAPRAHGLARARRRRRLDLFQQPRAGRVRALRHPAELRADRRHHLLLPHLLAQARALPLRVFQPAPLRRRRGRAELPRAVDEPPRVRGPVRPVPRGHAQVVQGRRAPRREALARARGAVVPRGPRRVPLRDGRSQRRRRRRARDVADGPRPAALHPDLQLLLGAAPAPLFFFLRARRASPRRRSSSAPTATSTASRRTC